MALAKLSAPLSALAGMIAALTLVVGEGAGFSLVGMAVIYGIVVGSCCYIFALCLAFLLCLPVPKSLAGLNGWITGFFLVVAPVLAGVVVHATLGRML